MNPENLVLILRELLEDVHLSQRQLAELCDLSLG
ncbi:MAG: winged helix-turn-helix transcriptional regulator, partial [Clostridiaceae bacterium]|nr:winged helix-turn-helix transcriptional regulator [Clostridiaceae bacterium]